MSRPTGRTVILSDTHLGKPRGGAGSAEALRPLWAGADRLVINGDVAEVHDASLRADAARQVLLIEQMCEADGVELTLISGNHDPLLTDLRHLELNNGEVYLTHGDVLHPAISPWARQRKRLRYLNTQAREALDPHEKGSTDGHLAAAQYASHFTWDEMARDPGHGVWGAFRHVFDESAQALRALWYWQTLPYAAARFAEQHAPEARFFIFGHIHRTGVWHLGGRVVINTGAFGFPFKPRAVVIEGGELTVRSIVRNPGRLGYRFGERAVARFNLSRKAA